jgi:hypothetical protein
MTSLVMHFPRGCWQQPDGSYVGECGCGAAFTGPSHEDARQSWSDHVAANPTPPTLSEDLREARLTTFLEILAAAGGKSDASDSPYSWINAFCETHEGTNPDTFNRAIDASYVTFSHDSDTDHSTISITSEGRAALAQVKAS